MDRHRAALSRLPGWAPFALAAVPAIWLAVFFAWPTATLLGRPVIMTEKAPGALGAQESGLIVICAIFGIPPQAALALSLVKRVPDLIIGIPGLIAWQAIEGWHFRDAHNGSAGGQNEQA